MCRAEAALSEEVADGALVDALRVSEVRAQGAEFRVSGCRGVAEVQGLEIPDQYLS